jgi:hypothetical protein
VSWSMCSSTGFELSNCTVQGRWLAGGNETEGLTHRSIVASRPALVKMLHTAGFSWVARSTGRVEHPDFIETS